MARCCPRCFTDPEVRDFIAANGEVGDCDYCGAKSVSCVYPADLKPLFQQLLELYEPLEAGRHYVIDPEVDTSDYGMPLGDLLQEGWEIFFEDLDSSAQNALTEHIFNANCSPKEWESTDCYIAKHEALFYSTWDARWTAFAYHLIHERRFILDDGEVSNLQDMIGESLHLVDHSLPAGQIGYRARRGYSEGEHGFGKEPFGVEDMGAPPVSRVLEGGRINPPGIAFLHLAFDRDTAAAEVRPHKGGIVTVARFVTKRDLRVADLTRVKPITSPFGKENLQFEIESRRLMRFLSAEFARPTDPDKAAVDYVPTQYAAEAIRAVGFDGIIYESSLGKANNLVLFDSEAAEGDTAELVEVTDVSYSVEPYRPRVDPLSYR